jgi:hypothetical protein
MQKDLIRTDEERATRLQLVKTNRLQRREKMLPGSFPTSSQKARRRVSHDVSQYRCSIYIFHFVVFRSYLN